MPILYQSLSSPFPPSCLYLQRASSSTAIPSRAWLKSLMQDVRLCPAMHFARRPALVFDIVYILPHA